MTLETGNTDIISWEMNTLEDNGPLILRGCGYGF